MESALQRFADGFENCEVDNSKKKLNKFYLAMSAELKDLVSALSDGLEANFPDHNKTKKLLFDTKVVLAKNGLLAGFGNCSISDYVLARKTLEVGALFSLADRDVPAFERYVAQLRSFYFDYKGDIPESELTYQILGLNLLCLLSQSRLAEFHMELELLPKELIHGNRFINHPVKLEQSLMEGRYNKIFDAQTKSPSPFHGIFLESLLETVRGDVASCIEKAYEKISAREAARMLRIINEADLRNFGQNRGWMLHQDGCYHFKPVVKKVEDRVPADELAKLQIDYARELEMII